MQRNAPRALTEGGPVTSLSESPWLATARGRVQKKKKKNGKGVEVLFLRSAGPFTDPAASFHTAKPGS